MIEKKETKNMPAGAQALDDDALGTVSGGRVSHQSYNPFSCQPKGFYTVTGNGSRKVIIYNDGKSQEAARKEAEALDRKWNPQDYEN